MLTGYKFIEASYFGGRYYSFEYNYAGGFPDQIMLLRKDDGERDKRLIGIWKKKR